VQTCALPILGHASRDLHTAPWDVGEAVGVVRRLVDGVGEILADLVPVDIERRDEVDVADVIAAEVDVHDPRDTVAGFGVPVIVDALHERARAVTATDDSDAYAFAFSTRRCGFLA